MSFYLHLKITYGVVPLLAGLDKYFNLLVDWEIYASEPLARVMDPQTLMVGIVGPVEILVGILVLTKWTHIAAYIVTVWLVLISINLIIGGFYDIAVRDLSMAVGAFALGQIATLKRRRSPAQASDQAIAQAG